MKDQAEINLYIRFALNQLPSENAHHTFERICFYLTRHNIIENVIPATGPVAHYGDQGRDFLRFKTYLDDKLNDNSNFLGQNPSGSVVAFTCSIAETIESKIKIDVKKIMDYGLPVDGIYYFAREDIPVGKNNKLKLWARNKYIVNLEIFDGNGIASLLTLSKNHWIAKRFLNVSESQLSSMLNLEVFFNNEGTTQSIKLPIKNPKSKIITANDIYMKERSGYKDIVKKLEYDSFFHGSKGHKEEEAAEITNQYNEYYKNRTIQFFLFNKGNETYNDIDIKIETILGKTLKIRHLSQIQKPTIPSLSQKHRKLIRAHKKAWDLRVKNKEEKHFENKEKKLKISKVSLNGKTKWSIKYHINYLRHNDHEKLEPIKIYIPENPPTKEIVFNFSFIQRESRIVEPQELKITLI